MEQIIPAACGPPVEQSVDELTKFVSADSDVFNITEVL